MKGPFERLKYDFRRGWECPTCKRREKTEFTVTSCFCPCGTKQDGGRPTSMLLVEDGVRRVWWPANWRTPGEKRPLAIAEPAAAATVVLTEQTEVRTIETLPDLPAAVAEPTDVVDTILEVPSQIDAEGE